MASEIRVNQIQNRSGLSTVTFSDTGVVISGITTISDLRTSGNTVVAAGSTSAPSISPTGDSNTGIFFPSPDTVAIAEGGVEALRVNSSGGVQIANGNLIFSTAGTGIDFSATTNSSGTMTSELLSDYEEGTFTPTLLGGATSITLNASINTLSYTKIGRRVFISGRINIGNMNGATSTLNFGNIPFVAASSGPGNSDYASLRVTYYNLDLPADGTGEIFIEIAGGSTGFGFQYLRDNSTWANINATSITTSTYLYITGSYLATS
jgi:hypothetical protein